MIKKINASFEVLSDKDKRQEYDKIGFNTILFEEDDAKKNNNNIHEQVQHDPSYNNNDYTSRSDNIYSDYGHNNNYYASRKPQKDNGNNRIDARTPTVLTDLDTPKARFHIIVEPSLCMAFGSCETLAPKVFVVEKNKRINPKARIESETGANLETILAAAQTCPTKAIRIIDRYTGEQIYP